MRKWFALILTLVLCMAVGVTTFLTSSVPASYATTVPEDRSLYNMGQIQEMLLAYFEENDMEYRLGSDEFLAYAKNQLIDYELSDRLLARQENYDLICSYLAHYIVSDQEDATSNFCLVPFYKRSDFLNTTIQDLRQGNAAYH